MVPSSLRTWFVVHFVADVLFAAPLLVAPSWLLGLLGWSCVDPVASRLVGAALLGIGVESLLGRNASAESFRGMLNLKVIWSGAATLGILASLLEGAAPPMAWAFLAVFAAFHLVWLRYRLLLRKSAGQPGASVL